MTSVLWQMVNLVKRKGKVSGPNPRKAKSRSTEGPVMLISADARQKKPWLHGVTSCLSLAASRQKLDGHFLVMLQRGFLHGWR